MPRNYQRKTVQKDPQPLAEALQDVKNGMPVTTAARIYGVSKTTLFRHRDGTKPVGRPTALTQTEDVIVNTINQMTLWGLGFDATDIKILVKQYLNQSGREVSCFQNNYPGPDFLQSFMKRNNLVKRTAGNIKRARSAVSRIDIENFFSELEKTGDVLPENFYNYDETALSDDPGRKKVVVHRGIRRIEVVREHSKSNVSIMVCGNAAGELLLPMVCYKSQNVYEGWTMGGPAGTVYSNTRSGWFESETFDKWFSDVFVPRVRHRPGLKVLIGDNLASHFNPNVIRAAVENNVYFCTLPPNATHIMQPLDVAVFKSFKNSWRMILDNFRKESRQKGVLPKTVFPSLLSQLWQKLHLTVANNLKSGFRACGLFPRNPAEPIRYLPGENLESEEVGRTLDRVLVDMLQANRDMVGTSKATGRGAKVVPGRRIHQDDLSRSQSSSSSEITRTSSQVVTRGGDKPSRASRVRASSSSSSSSEEENDLCASCGINFNHSSGPD